MKAVAGDVPLPPRELFLRVSEIAWRLGRDVAGDELFLLALLELPRDGPARAALEAEGVTGDRVLAEIRTPGDEESGDDHRTLFPPSINTILGRAQAFGATLSDGPITAEHLLLALIWDPVSHSSQLLWRLGVQRERIIARLRGQGTPTPAAPLPEQREIEMGERVWFHRGEAPRVLLHLGKRIEPGTQWGFDYDGDRAYVWAESRIELETLVDEARLTDD